MSAALKISLKLAPVSSGHFIRRALPSLPGIFIVKLGIVLVT